jgi:hypothetical protein
MYINKFSVIVLFFVNVGGTLFKPILDPILEYGGLICRVLLDFQVLHS